MSRIYQIGEVIKTESRGRFSIAQVVDRVAYARNGNAHNPTIYVRYDLRIGDRTVGMFPTRREARQAAESNLWG